MIIYETASSTASRLYPHDHARCGPHARRTIHQNGRALLLCPNQGFHIATHDALAGALAFEAPRLPMGEWPGSYRYPSAVRSVVAVRLASQAPGGHWKVPDVVVPPNTYADVTIHHASSESRVRGAHDGRTCVLHGLHLEDEGKLRHYQRERAPGGPLAPATGTLVPFAITSGGLLAPSAKDLLKRFARDRSAFQDREDDPLSASSSYLRHSVQLISTVLQRWNACRIHAAAAEYCTLHRDPAAPWPVGVDDLQQVHRLNPGPGVRGLLSIASHYGLADIDVVGLRPVASLLD